TPLYYLLDAPLSTEIYTLSLHDALPISGITIENGVAKLTRTAEDQKVTLKATVSYNNETKTKNFVVTVAAEPYLAYYRITLDVRSEEHTSELQSRFDLVCRLLLEK